jgi:hypothetical protein
MRALQLKTVKFVLELDEMEAKWLKAYVQNSHTINDNDESITDRERREMLFNNLKNAGVE